MSAALIQREDRLEPHHEDEEEARGDEVERQRGEVLRDRLCHALVQVHAGRDLARRALRVEGHRQRQRLRHEAVGRGAGGATEGIHQHARLDAEQDRAGHGRDEQSGEQRHRDAVHVRDQHLVHEAAEEPRQDQPRQHEQQPHDEGRRDRALEALEMTRERAQDRRRVPAGLELGRALEGEHDAGESLVELFRIDNAPPARGIVQVRASAAEALDDHEVVEVHEHDGGHRQLRQLARLLAEAARGEPVRARGAQQAARLAAVAAHAAIDAHLLEGHVAPVEGEDHRERSGAALHRLQLQDRWDAPDRRLGEGPRQLAGRCGLFGSYRADSSHAANAATAASNIASETKSARG